MDKKSSEEQPETASGKRISHLNFGDVGYLYWALLILMILFTAVVRLRLLDIPLERDEGEFAYMGQLLLQGIPPYQISYNMKLPGIYAAYALMMLVFGQTAAGIHLGLLVVNAATIVLVYLLTLRLFDRFTGLIAGCSFAILSLSPTVLGSAAHATHFVILFALAGILVLLKSMESGKTNFLLFSGFLSGLSILMKQPGLFFCLFSLLYLLFTLYRRPDASFRMYVKQTGLFLAGAVVPIAMTCVYLYLSGVFDKFWFWTFSYAYQYVAETSFSQGILEFKINMVEVIGKLYLFWFFAAVGIGFLFREKAFKAQMPFVLGLFLISFLAVCPGLIFRSHYFVLLLPSLSLLLGVAAGGSRRWLMSRQPRFQFIPAIVFTVMVLLVVFQYRAFFFEWTPNQTSRALYALNPFPESVEIASYIKAHTAESDRIAVIGSEPQIYFYANRHSATGYIYTYPLMEEQKYARQMQREMIDEVEKAKPRYLVFVGVASSWMIRPSSDRHIFRWFGEYSRKEYEPVGFVDLGHSQQIQYRWGDEAKFYIPESPVYLLVCKRRG
ncbi:MAG TPA: glycosyltransferase family 39 protein [Syntrophales bacterium]|nr:glycosyltransferase family 39 protein [Syntrophales bacterium]